MAKIVFYVGYMSTPWCGETLYTVGLGGTETSVIKLAEEYAKHDHEVYVIGNRMIVSEHNGVLYRESSENTVRTLGAIDVLVGVGYLHFPLHFAKVHTGERIFWLHNEEPYMWYNGQQLTAEQLVECVRGIDTIWVPSAIGQYYIQRFTPILSDKRIEIVPNAIDSTVPCDLRMKYEQVAGNGFNVVYTSCVTRGLAKVLHAWPLIKSTYPNATLTISYPSYSLDMNGASEILSLATDKWYKDQGVTVVGSLPKPQLYDLLSRSHLWLYPTTYDETFCITAIEMIAHGVTIVTSDSGNLSSFAPYSLIEQFDSNRAISSAQILQAVMNVVQKWTDNYTDSMVALHEHMDEVLEYYTWDRVYTVSSATMTNLFSKTTTESFFDTVYIITDDYDSVRTQTIPVDCVQRVRNLGIRGGNTRFYIVPAADGRAITPEILKSYQLSIYSQWKLPDSSNGWWNRDMLPGELGCAISHMTVWHHAYQVGAKCALILESDFNPLSFVDDGVDYSELPDDWDLLYLGRNLLPGYNDTEFGSNSFVKPGPSYNLHAYAISRKGAKNLMDYNFGNKLMPVDEFIPATYGAHPREDLEFIWRDVNAYATRRDVIVQRNNKNTTISGLSGDVNLKSVIDTLNTYMHVREHVYQTQPISTVVAQPTSVTDDEPSLCSYFDHKDKWIKKYVHQGVAQKQWELIGDMPIPGVFAMDMFTEAFCNELIELAEKENKWTVARHEFYPTTDFLLSDIGIIGDIYNDLIREYVVPAARYYYGLEGSSWNVPTSENFVARYTPDTQALLSLHHDFSDVTALINLSKPTDYTGGGTYFQLYKATHIGKQGQLTLHPGRVSHRHGGRPVTSGKRYILVSFINSSK